MSKKNWQMDRRQHSRFVTYERKNCIKTYDAKIGVFLIIFLVLICSGVLIIITN